MERCRNTETRQQILKSKSASDEKSQLVDALKLASYLLTANPPFLAAGSGRPTRTSEAKSFTAVISTVEVDIRGAADEAVAPGMKDMLPYHESVRWNKIRLSNECRPD